MINFFLHFMRLENMIHVSFPPGVLAVLILAAFLKRHVTC